MLSDINLFASGDPLSSVNPVTGETVWQGQSSTLQDVNQAVRSARQSFTSWSMTKLDQRITIARKFADMVGDRAEELAIQIAQDTGKALWDAKTEISAVIGKVEISIRALTERAGQSETDLAAGHLRIAHRPHGIMAVLGPFNFPAHLPNGHIVPALLAGNTLVFKPSEQASLVAQTLAQCWAQAGLPRGVLNMIYGAGATGKELVEHQDVDGVLFTGGVPTGLAIHTALAGQPQKILALELGGNNPLVAWDLQDREAAAQTSVFSAFVSAGQRCTCARRLIVPNNEWGADLVQDIVALSKQLSVHDPLAEEQPFMGSLISAQAAEDVLSAFDALVQQGAEPLLNPERPEPQGAFVTPGIIDVTGIGDIPDTEIFGPLLQVIRVSDFDQAIQEANNTRFGLAAALLSDHEELFQQFSAQVRAGIINWNKPTAGASSMAPFGGVGVSGNHRPAGYYAADYCAFPVASLSSDLQPMALTGLKP